MSRDPYKKKLIEKKKVLVKELEKYDYPLDWREISNLKYKIESIDFQLKDKKHIKQVSLEPYFIPKM